MRWKGRRQSTNISDQRGRGGGGFGLPSGGRGGRLRIPTGGGARRASGGMGCGTLVIIGVVLWFLGINPLTLLAGGGGMGGMLGGGSGSTLSPETFQPRSTNTTRNSTNNDEMKQFVSTIIASTEEVWSGIFSAYGKKYPAPQLVIFSGQIQSACGFASAASGPFYCPGDQKAYIDFSFFNELATKFGAKGDFAQAYVLAHEVGHHVQNVIGVLPQFNRMRQRMGKVEANKTVSYTHLRSPRDA